MEIMEFSLQVTYCMTVSSQVTNSTFIMFSHVFVNHNEILLKIIVINPQRCLLYQEKHGRVTKLHFHKCPCFIFQYHHVQIRVPHVLCGLLQESAIGI